MGYALRKIFVLLIISVLLVGCNNSGNDFSNKIIKTIDGKCEKGGSCTFKMSDITDFRWDKLVVYGLGSSQKEISRALGVRYKDSVDMTSGMVFVYKGKIVKKLKMTYNPDYPGRPSKLSISNRNKPNAPTFRLITKGSDTFLGIKEEIGGVYYYNLEL